MTLILTFSPLFFYLISCDYSLYNLLDTLGNIKPVLPSVAVFSCLYGAVGRLYTIHSLNASPGADMLNSEIRLLTSYVTLSKLLTAYSLGFLTSSL